MSVDPATGARTLVSGPGRGTGPAFVSPIGVTSDSPDSIVVLDMDHSAGTGLGRGALIRVDLASGKRTLLSDNATPSGGQQFDTPIDVRYNACEKAFYVLQTGFTPATPKGPGAEGRRRDRSQDAVRLVPGRGELRPAPSSDPGPAALATGPDPGVFTPAGGIPQDHRLSSLDIICALDDISEDADEQDGD